jgi:Tol biopolymer transport system component
MNIAPSLSPDGENVIFISDKNVISIDFYLADIENKKITKQLTKVIKDPHIDAYSFLESAGTWSPDGKQFAVTSFSKGQNTLIITDLETEKIASTINTDSLQAFNNPAWSPDGKKILLSGLKKGNSDLFLYHLDSKKVEQLTHDRYSDLQPAWSPDGSKIIFVSDRDDETNLNIGEYGNYRLTEYNINTGEINAIDILIHKQTTTV